MVVWGLGLDLHVSYVEVQPQTLPHHPLIRGGPALNPTASPSHSWRSSPETYFITLPLRLP